MMKFVDNLAKSVLPYFHLQLDDKYPTQEVDAFAYACIEEVLGLSRIQLALDPEHRMHEGEMLRLIYMVKDLKKFRPLQYILGKTNFAGIDLKVHEGCLIPRPETEELVQLVMERHADVSSIVDVCSGSGCIALALKSHFKKAHVKAIEFSDRAIEIIQENMDFTQLSIEVEQRDVLKAKGYLNDAQIVVSNPPYVMLKEQAQMQNNVLEHEPHMALFVEDDDPLIFYEAITDTFQKEAQSGAFLYFEINENLGEETAMVLKKAGLQKVNIVQDFYGKDRFVTGQKI